MTRSRLAVLVLAVLVASTAGCARKEQPAGQSGEAASKLAVAGAMERHAPPPPAIASDAAPHQLASSPPPPDGQVIVPVPTERKLIREGQATLEVKSVDAALTRLRELAREAGGYTTSESRLRDEQRVNRGRIECRVPAAKLDSVSAALKALGTVESLTVSASDITEEYFDLEIRLRNQRALEARLLALLERPTNRLSDLLDAERELARVRGEIDQMEGRRRFWDNRVALSTLSVEVHEPVPAVGGNEGGALSMLRHAFREAADNFVSAVAGIIAVTGGLLPVLAAFALVVWALVRGWRYRRSRRAARHPGVTTSQAR